MKIAGEIEMLEITANIMGSITTVHPTLIWDSSTVVLVDAGYPGEDRMIREQIKKAGAPLDKLSKIIITHHDMDHIGGLPGILDESPQRIDVLAHQEEKPYIQGERHPVKMTPELMAQLQAQLNLLSEENRMAAAVVFANPPKAAVSRTIVDGEELQYCGGITVIHTPGHTPGHISLYLNQSHTLVTGDAMIVVNGILFGPVPEQAFDPELAHQSLQKLSKYDIETVICYHGGVYRDNPNERIAELIRKVEVTR